jgi:ATP-dependent DNA ligase
MTCRKTAAGFVLQDGASPTIEEHFAVRPCASFNEHIAQDGPIVFAHACRLGAEGIVSKKIDSTYRSGPCRVWIKVRNPATAAVGARCRTDEPFRQRT